MTKEFSSITFTVPDGVTEMVAYEWCNKHGLWAGPAVQVPATETLIEEKSLAISDECSVSDFPEAAWPSVHADFLRLQAQVFESETPFTEADGEKHVPYITVNKDGTSSILVGKVGGPIHPMNGSADGETTPHWITEVYVVDQDGKIVAMKSLDPTGVTEATMTFDTPKEATTLQAYAWCNIHGLYEGPVTAAKVKDAEEEVEVKNAEEKVESSGTAAVVSLGVIASAVTLTALEM
jgi:desulfoferrodoxin (superoxide reductase-like protein)